MSFTFNFSGDDIEDGEDEVGEAAEGVNDLSLDAKAAETERVESLALDDLVSTSWLKCCACVR